MVMEKQNFLRLRIENELQEKIKTVASANSGELEKLIQDLSAHYEELEQQNQQLVSSQNELTTIKEKYTDLFENAPVGYLILDSSLRIREANKTACVHFSAKCDELTGKSFKEFVDEAYHKLFDSCFNEFVSDNLTSKCDVKLKTTTADFFARIIVSVSVTDGAPGDFRIAVVDISKEKELEDKLIEGSKNSRENERLKSAFMANVSHEIRTPMNGIIGFSELLQDPDLSPENLQSYINIIQNSGKRMLSIINELVDISKIESGSARLILAQTNVDELLNYIHESFLPQAAKKGLNLILDSEKYDQDFTIKTDKEKLHAVFVNLLKNAISYTSEGKVTFGYSRNDGQLGFFVSDTGVGISQEEQDQIFERFYHARSLNSQPTEGVGLGLPVSKAYVEMLGGTIRVESEPGIGSTFHFTIPVDETDEKDTGKNQLAMLDDPGELMSYLSILVAEDDEPARLYLSELLKNKCKEIHFAKNGREAVDLYAELKPDLVLMDIKMPIMDGYSAAIKIKGMDENAVIIAQTAYALAGDREKALAAGCSDYLAKPVLREDLIVMIRKHFM